MSVSPYQGLMAAPVPRPEKLIAAYVEHNTTDHRNTIWGFVAFGIVMWLLAGTLDASGGHSGSVLASYGKALLIMGPLSMLLIGPVLLFWSVNKSSLTRLLREGQALPARERTRDVFHLRGSQVVKIATEFSDPAGRVAQARFEMPLAKAPPLGTSFVVLRGSGRTVAVLWPDESVMLARLL